MKQGDFTDLAQFYHSRPGYSEMLVSKLVSLVCDDVSPTSCTRRRLSVVEFGAGTGKLSSILSKLDLVENLICVEPNDNMRSEGMKYTHGLDIDWRKGSSESNDVDTGIADLVIMASSFHWCDEKRALPEFHRILRDKGSFCCLWNPRTIEPGSVFDKIEQGVNNIVHDLKRVSSGNQKHTKAWEKVLVSTGHFHNCYFMECDHFETMTRDRYICAWKSVNDIQAQAGEERWQQILDMIEFNMRDIVEIQVPYKTRAWIAGKLPPPPPQ